MKKLLLLSSLISSVCFGDVSVEKTRERDLTRDDEVVTGISGVASQAELDEVKSLTSAISSIVIGDDCELVSTNYNSATKLPSLFLRFKIKDEATGEMVWYKVWDEMTRWRHLFDEHLPSNYLTKAQIQAELDQKADRAWGHYDSHTGGYAPDGFTWISSPKIAIAGGLAYQRVVMSEGAIFVLMSNGMTTFTGGETNGFFRISDDKGKALFEITKGTESVQGATSYVKGAEQINGYTHLYLDYYVESPKHLTIEVCTDLHKLDWKTETDSGCLANVVWTGESGHYKAEVWGKQPFTVLFVRASYIRGAKDVIKHHAPVEFGPVVIGGTTYNTLKVEEMNGKKVLVVE